VIVSVAEDRSGHLHLVAENALGRIAARIDAGLDLFNDDSFATFLWLHNRYILLCK
jgi:hypothetical protein